MIWIALFLVACSLASMGMAKLTWRKHLDHRKERVWWALNFLTGLSAAVIAYVNMGDDWWRISSGGNIQACLLFVLGVSFAVPGAFILALEFLAKVMNPFSPHN